MAKAAKWSDIPKRKRALYRALAEGAPELLTDADMAYHAAIRAPRAKPVQSEKVDVQRPLVVYLRRHLPAGSVVFTVPNASRSKQQTFALIRDGMLPGMPDVGVIVPEMAYIREKSSTLGFRPAYTAGVFFIECKRPDGRGKLSEAQQHVQSMLTALGVPVLAECTSVQQAIAWLHQQGVEFRP